MEDGGRSKGKGLARSLSKNLLGLKFMQRRAESALKKETAEREAAVASEARWVMPNTGQQTQRVIEVVRGFSFFEDEPVLARVSYNAANPAVEKMNVDAEQRKGSKAPSPPPVPQQPEPEEGEPPAKRRAPEVVDAAVAEDSAADKRLAKFVGKSAAAAAAAPAAAGNMKRPAPSEAPQPTPQPGQKRKKSKKKKKSKKNKDQAGQ